MTEAASPLVCICVPVYNSARTLPETLDSLLGQSYRNISILVVDNASTDNTAGIADGYAVRDPRVNVFRNSENIGPEGNFTRCLGLSRGDYTAIFHADDIYTPGMVEEQVAFLEAHPQAGAVFVMAQAIDEAGTPGRVYRLPSELRRPAPSLYAFDEIFRVLLKYGNFFFCPGTMARTEVYRDKILVWDASGYRSSADLDVWLRILKLSPVGIIDKPLLRYRGEARASFSYTAARKKTGPHDMLRVFEAYIKGASAALMGKTEEADYALLQLKDNINRAFTYFAAGQGGTGRTLLGGLFSPRNLAHSLQCAFHFKAVLYGYTVYLLSWLPLSEKARLAVCRLRFGK